MDPRTGLGRFRDFRISNYQLMMQLIDACTRDAASTRSSSTPDVAERVELYFEHAAQAAASRSALLHGARQPRGARPPRRGGHPPDEPLHDLRAVPPVQHLDPRALGPASSRTPCSRPASRSSTAASKTNVGELMLSYGGGGHEAAGTCQIDNEDAERVLGELVDHDQRRRLRPLTRAPGPCPSPGCAALATLMHRDEEARARCAAARRLVGCGGDDGSTEDPVSRVPEEGGLQESVRAASQPDKSDFPARAARRSRSSRTRSAPADRARARRLGLHGRQRTASRSA